jgi:hypothetical protein
LAHSLNNPHTTGRWKMEEKSLGSENKTRRRRKEQRFVSGKKNN